MPVIPGTGDARYTGYWGCLLYRVLGMPAIPGTGDARYTGYWGRPLYRVLGTPAIRGTGDARYTGYWIEQEWIWRWGGGGERNYLSYHKFLYLPQPSRVTNVYYIFLDVSELFKFYIYRYGLIIEKIQMHPLVVSPFLPPPPPLSHRWYASTPLHLQGRA